MSDLLGVTSQPIFLSRVEESTNDIYSMEDSFTLISVKVEAYDGRVGTQEVLGLLARQIKRAIVNPRDCYSFWNNTFYVLTYLDNKEVVENFINHLGAIIEKRYENIFYLKAAHLEYPYDVIDVHDIFSELKEKEIKVSCPNTDLDSELMDYKEYNQMVSKELARYLNLIKQYGDVLYNHSLLVAKISVGIARALNLSAQVIKKIVVAAILHDVGYLCIPQKLSSDPTHQNSKTFALVKMHSLLATRKVLAEKPMFREIFHSIEQHHEYIDGSGYPFGLSGRDLSLESQIIAIADTYDLIRHQNDISNVEIADFFQSMAGVRWDEKLTTVFSSILHDEKQVDNLTSNKESSLVDFLTWI